MINSEQVLSSLKNIIDPDFKQDIVSLGFIKNLKIDNGEVHFDIVLTTPACPVKDEFHKKAHALVSALPEVKAVHINMTAMAAKSDRPQPQFPSTLRDVRSIIAVSSCKGGVGKSTVAAHLAVELARQGFRVGLVDVDIHGPSIPTLFNFDKVKIYVNEQKQIIPLDWHGLKIMSFGFLLGDAPAVLRGPIVSQYVQQILHNTAWGTLDYLFIDMPPGTGDVQLTITQTTSLSGAVIVTTRQSLSLVDVSRGILMFEKVNVPILGIIENMSYFLCDQCQKKHYIFGREQAQSLQERFGLPTLAEIPLLSSLTGKIIEPVGNSFFMTAVEQTVRALGKSIITDKQIPEISYDKACLTLKWLDGQVSKIPHRSVRLSCRCALCVNEMTGELIIKESEIPQDIMPVKVFPLGNYAIAIEWSDGHSSGIYPYMSLRAIGSETNTA